MENQKQPKRAPWKIILGVISIAYILFTWVKKDIVGAFVTMPKEQAIPMLATTIGVSVLKVLLIIGVIFLAKKLYERNE